MHRWLGKNQTQPTRLETPENQTVWKLLKTRHRGIDSLLTRDQPRNVYSAAMLAHKLLDPGSLSRPSLELVKSNHWEIIHFIGRNSPLLGSLNFASSHQHATQPLLPLTACLAVWHLSCESICLLLISIWRSGPLAASLWDDVILP